MVSKINSTHSVEPSLYASNLKALMDQRKVSSEQLCEKLGITENRFKRWQEGVCFPKTEVMVAICDLLRYWDIYAMLTRHIGEEIEFIPPFRPGKFAV